MLGPTLHELRPFASALGPANNATRALALQTTPILKNEIRPFAREILPTIIGARALDTKELSEAFPKLASSFSVLNEFFNELGYNPSSKQAGFGFFAGLGRTTTSTAWSAPPTPTGFSVAA